MSNRKEPPSSRALTRDTPLSESVSSPDSSSAASSAPDIEAKSTLLSIGAGGRPRSGMKLADLADEAPLPKLTMGAEKYRILSELGSGGMGKVYLAYDQDLRRRVALKVLRVAEPIHVRRFLEEAQVMAQLQHPNIVPVHEVGLTAGKPYYTMPVVRGRTLSDVIKQLRAGDQATRREFSLARLMQVFVQVGQAMAYAHAKGVIHRDLKPPNVMLGGHGEVQVMDWGLSKVVEAGDIDTAGESSLTATGHILGTPHYMAPEQAKGKEATAAADIYAMGVMLYELLVLERPFSGNSTELMAAHIRDQPMPPRQRASRRNIPLELEAVCLRALNKEPGGRPASANAMLAEVQTWAEAEADRTRRHELAEAKAEEGRAKLAEYQRLKGEVVRLEAEAVAVRGTFESWQPAAEKAALVAAEDAVRNARDRLVDSASEVVETLERALEYEDDHAVARELLADYYWDRRLGAEARFDAENIKFFSSRVARYHDGKYTRELKGDGSLTLTSDPAGAAVWLHQLVEEGFVLVERNEREIGTTPLAATPLAMGSYLVVLKKEGYRDTRYAVYISRNRAWTGTVKLATDAEIGEGFVHVPVGPCIVGGDGAVALSLPRAEPEVDDFFIATQPVTMAEYLEFVNDLAAREGLDAARERSPRRVADDPRSGYLLEDGRGGLRLPEIDAEGDRWYPRWPAYGISCHDAMAYCEWRSLRDGVTYRLASEQEWEKAARGVDGRWFPWGWRFDPSLCNMRESRQERTAVVVIDEFPTDVSVYGVRGLAGNMREWTSTEQIEGTGPGRRVSRVLRGGCWYFAAHLCRAAYRLWNEPTVVLDNLGFRLSRSR